MLSFVMVLSAMELQFGVFVLFFADYADGNKHKKNVSLIFARLCCVSSYLSPSLDHYTQVKHNTLTGATWLMHPHWSNMAYVLE